MGELLQSQLWPVHGRMWREANGTKWYVRERVESAHVPGFFLDLKSDDEVNDRLNRRQWWPDSAIQSEVAQMDAEFNGYALEWGEGLTFGIDGSSFFFLFGSNIQAGIAGFGDTVSQAWDQFYGRTQDCEGKDCGLCRECHREEDRRELVAQGGGQ